VNKTAPIALAACLLGPATSIASSGHEEAIAALAMEKIKPWLNNPVLVASLRDQNARHASISQADIDRLDQQWRTESAAANRPLIDSLLGNTLSSELQRFKSSAQGLYTEIFVMDAHGLNVGQSDVTSDYWQGDEAKWQKTFLLGPDAIHVGDIEHDESSQMFQSQVSLSVVDPASSDVLGAITVGINVDLALQ